MTPRPRSVPLLTLDQAVAHLKLPTVATMAPADVADYQLKLDAAQEFVLRLVRGNRVGATAPAWAEEVDAWTPDTAPRVVLAAIVRMFAAYDADRDLVDAKSIGLGELPPLVQQLLHQLIDPGLAVPDVEPVPAVPIVVPPVGLR